MSFRGRLTLFFIGIVAIPMIVVAILLVRVTEDSREGKADASLAPALQSAQLLYDRALERAPEIADRIATSDGVLAALRASDSGFLLRTARQESSGPTVEAVRFFDAGGERLAAVGSPTAIAVSRRPIRSGGERIGVIEVARLDERDYVTEINVLTGIDATLVADSGRLASTTPLRGVELPTEPGATTVQGPEGDLRAAALSLEGAPEGSNVVLTTGAEAGFVASQPVVAAVLALFFGISLVLILYLLRMLQRQIAAMLLAAQRIGAGDFSRRLPDRGGDELAGLAREFNRMSDRLSAQMTQLRGQREELDQSVRRIGEAFASGLDRTSLLEIVIETARAACGAEAGQIVLRGAGGRESEVGQRADATFGPALRRAAQAAAEAGALVEIEADGVRALAHPLDAAGDSGAPASTMAVARRGPSFTSSEREVLQYLIVQAATSVENIRLHDQVAEQAVTDDLTALANHRHFLRWVEVEADRIRRFGGELSLVLFDIDDFKEINDAFGHLHGDRVLAAVGRVLKGESRGIDEAARYGGEEFVLALPETSKVGAVEVAERIRRRIESVEVAGPEGMAPSRITVSLGVATMPTDGAGTHALIAAADAAMYEAKRAGKNRIAAAGERLEAKS